MAKAMSQSELVRIDFFFIGFPLNSFSFYCGGFPGCTNSAGQGPTATIAQKDGGGQVGTGLYSMG